jgi:hypothetical protein
LTSNDLNTLLLEATEQALRIHREPLTPHGTEQILRYLLDVINRLINEVAVTSGVASAEQLRKEVASLRAAVASMTPGSSAYHVILEQLHEREAVFTRLNETSERAPEPKATKWDVEL